MTEIYFSAPAYVLGSPIRISESSIPDDWKKKLLSNTGLHTFLISDKNSWELGKEAVSKTVEQLDIPANNIDTLIISSDSISSKESKEALHGFIEHAGILNAFPMIVTMGACCNFQLAARSASALVRSGESKNTLIVSVDTIGERGANDEFLINPVGGFTFSDGAASCLISATARDGAFKLTSTFINHFEMGYMVGANPVQPLDLYLVLRKLFTKAYAEWGIDAGMISKMITNNTTVPEASMHGSAAFLKERHIFLDNIPRVGHCFSADPIINLKDHSDSGDINVGDKILVFGSGPFQWGGFMLEQV